jgi:hypothetical protein
MDVKGASYYIFGEKGNKGSQMGHTKKYLTSDLITYDYLHSLIRNFLIKLTFEMRKSQ